MEAFSTERLKEARKKKFRSQAEFAAAMGMSKIKISRWESGERTPSVEDLAKISEVLGVRRSFFLGEYDETTAVSEEDSRYEREAAIRKAKDFSPYLRVAEHAVSYAMYLQDSDLEYLAVILDNASNHLRSMKKDKLSTGSGSEQLLSISAC